MPWEPRPRVQMALRESDADSIEVLLEELWCGEQVEPELRDAILRSLREAQERLKSIDALEAGAE